MKKNRSNTYTTGICCTNSTDDLRFPFFEIDVDEPNFQEKITDILDVYREWKCDYIVHKTGNGLHFLSPTLLTKEQWKRFMSELNWINTKCPMTTLRWHPNKYEGESEIWTISESHQFSENIRYNCEEMCFLLNHAFGTKFQGCIIRELKFVRYPLPI